MSNSAIITSFSGVCASGSGTTVSPSRAGVVACMSLAGTNAVLQEQVQELVLRQLVGQELSGTCTIV